MTMIGDDDSFVKSIIFSYAATFQLNRVVNSVVVL
jgi:hypothetical protein